MDSVTHSAATPKRSHLARTFAKVLHTRKMNKEGFLTVEEERDKAVREAFMARLFSGLSSIKASYAQLQHAQSPYDAAGIQSADKVIVAELKKLSELKQSYLKKELHESSPATAQAQEHRSLLTMYEITSKKLDSQLKLKESEMVFLKEKLVEINTECKLLDKRLKQLLFPPSHFVALLRQAVDSVRSFVRLLVHGMESEGWDLDAAAAAIQPGVSYWERNHVCFAFESFVCREMFDGFSDESVDKENRLGWKPESKFEGFCRAKYLRVVHPKMEASNRNLEKPFVEMARRLWLLHCLGMALDEEVAIFRVRDGSRFSEVYMESVSEEAFEASSEPTLVAFTVVPGFRVASIVVQSQVYLTSTHSHHQPLL